MAVREPTKQDFIQTWPKGYNEDFRYYTPRGGATEHEVVSQCLSPFFNREKFCVEIGCGKGFWVNKYLCPNFKHVTGLDLHSKPLSRVWNFNYIEVPNQNYDCHGIPDNCIDFVWSFGVFCHLPLHAIQKYLNSIHRILKPGGQASLFFSDNNKCPGHVSGDDIGSGIIWVENNNWYEMTKWCVKNPNVMIEKGLELAEYCKDKYDLIKWAENRKQIYLSLLNSK
jgi:SAM-dependent methyltransferase